MKQYIDLVAHIARRYHIPATSCLEPADLIQEGYLGLLEGFRRLDPSRRRALDDLGSSETAYLAHYIHKFISEAIHRYRSAVSYPPSRLFTDDDATISLDTIIHHGQDGSEDITLADTIPDPSPTPEQLLITLQDEQRLYQALACLTPREQLILTRLYGLDNHDPDSAETLATALSVSKWSIHKLRERALRKLQKNAVVMSNFAYDPVYS